MLIHVQTKFENINPSANLRVNKMSEEEGEASTVTPIVKRRKNYETIRCLDFMAELKSCLCKSNTYNQPDTISFFLASYNRFHQYYIHGKFLSCDALQKQIQLCMKWRTSQSMEAKVPIKRKREREYLFPL